METKANYLMIGGFVLGVLAFAFIFVFWMSNFAGGGKRYYVVFDSSVAGLTTGSSVGFQGLKVGEVQSFSLDQIPDSVAMASSSLISTPRTPAKSTL